LRFSPVAGGATGLVARKKAIVHEHVRLLDEIRPLHDPVLLAAFVGWTDGHGVAASTIEYLTEQWDARPLADLDPEPFYDFTVQRPRTRNHRGTRVLDWPANRFLVASPPGANRDFLLFYGIEPHLRWRVFNEAVLDVLRETGTTTSVTMGAQPGAVPHTRPVPVTLSASDKGFEEQFGLKIPNSRYEGPTGLLSVLNVQLRALQWRNASLWALTPHYLNVGPNPNAMISLLHIIDRGFGTVTPLEPLEERVAVFDVQLQEALDPSSEAATYVRSLEEQFDAQMAQGMDAGQPGRTAELPSSDEILGDLEQFLKQQRDDQ
jgi:hypothetical protein